MALLEIAGLNAFYGMAQSLSDVSLEVEASRALLAWIEARLR